jgi:hypothetical protein
MKIFLIVLTLLSTNITLAQNSDDFLAKESVNFQAQKPAEILDVTLDNVQSVFQRYKANHGPGVTVISPLQIGGTRDNPTVKTTTRRCVAFICKTITLDAVISVEETQGNCTANYLMKMDLNRSSQDLAEVYSQINIKFCLKSAGQNASLELTGSAKRAATYSEGRIQKEILKSLQLQISPIVLALNQTLKANGAR